MSTTNTPCCHSLSPPNSRVRVLKPSRPTQFSLNSTLRFTATLYAYPTKKWRSLCFRHQESSSAIPESKFVEDKLSEELVNPGFNQIDDVQKDWISRLRKVTDALFGAEPWTVPWTAKTIIQVMLLWIASFWLVGSWVVPFLAHTAGFRKESLTYRGQALYSLLNDVAEGLAGIAILHHCLTRFHPLPSNWFKFSLEGKWQFDVGLGCLMFPLVNRLSQINLNLLPILPSTPVTVSNVQQSIVARDPVAMALYAVVVSVCAPIWEEIVFRGFLLPSLTKYMPVWCSILVSSVAFALAHFNMLRMLPLIFLGVVMGVVFARSRNLLPSMLLHSLWNAFVFLDLMK
ncbi:CAAX amino terminal protease family [Fagus crenata]